MRNLHQDNITLAVIASFSNTQDPRLKDIMTSLVQHLHAFVRDVKLIRPAFFKDPQLSSATAIDDPNGFQPWKDDYSSIFSILK